MAGVARFGRVDGGKGVWRCERRPRGVAVCSVLGVGQGVWQGVMRCGGVGGKQVRKSRMGGKGLLQSGLSGRVETKAKRRGWQRGEDDKGERTAAGNGG